MPTISRRATLFVLGAFCADIAATRNRTAAMYFMNDASSRRGRKNAFPLIESHQGSEARSTYGSPAKRDFGYLQPLSLKDENHLWATMCKLKQEKTECFAANVGRICPMSQASAIHADLLLLGFLLHCA